ncbi:MAG TPA: MFS transporter [Candidatus Binataceae bacterium]|nr:MFS transporter [Candidatus Binataceae bacterium]
MAQSAIPPSIVKITRHYYLVWWFYAFGGGFVYGVYPLFLRARGLNLLQANGVLATYFLITFVTDLPTGAFADALDRRRAFLLACTLRACAFALYFFARGYWLFVLAEAIDALGTTFGNGAIDAWAVDALEAAGFVGMKDRIFSRASQLTTVGWLTSALTGAYIANHNLAWPWLLGAAGYALSLMVGALLMKGRAKARVQPRDLVHEIAGRARNALALGFNNRAILMLTLAYAAQTGAWAPYWMMWPDYFVDHLGVGVWIIGWLFCLFSVGRLIGAEVIVHMPPYASRRAPMLSWLALACGGLLLAAGLAAGHVILMLALLFGMNCCSGAMQPLALGWINEQLEADSRATLLSFQSTFATLGGAIGLLLCGWMALWHGLMAGWYLAATLGLFAAWFYSRLGAAPKPAIGASVQAG